MKAKLTNTLVAGFEPRDRPYEVHDTVVSGLLLRIQPSGLRTYYVAYRLEGGRHGKRGRVKLGSAAATTPAQARERALKALGQVADGRDPAAAKRAAKTHTLRSYLDDVYEAWALQHLRSGAEQVRRIRRGFPELMGKRLGDITVWLVEKRRAARLKDGLRSATLNKDCHALRAALGRAVTWGIIEDNPLRNLKPLPERDSTPKLRYLTPDEEKRLSAALDDREERIRRDRDSYNKWAADRDLPGRPGLRAVAFADHVKPMVVLSLHTGVRRGELFGLRWGDIDLGRAMLTVGRDVAKAGKERHIPLNAVALETLRDWREQTPGDDDGLVFPSLRTGTVFTNIKKAWTAVLEAAGIEGFRWHDLRHSFASRLVMAGVDLNTVRDLLGHGDIKMTLRYAHLAPEHKRSAVERLAVAGPAVLERARGAEAG